jgi:hypothetical protein
MTMSSELSMMESILKDRIDLMSSMFWIFQVMVTQVEIVGDKYFIFIPYNYGSNIYHNEIEFQ